MPTYNYSCENTHLEEKFHAIGEYPDYICKVCENKMYRVLSAPAVHFKGSGFYSKDKHAG
jgi:putative FmdB family regulatory protein